MLAVDRGRNSSDFGQEGTAAVRPLSRLGYCKAVLRTHLKSPGAVAGLRSQLVRTEIRRLDGELAGDIRQQKIGSWEQLKALLAAEKKLADLLVGALKRNIRNLIVENARYMRIESRGGYESVRFLKRMLDHCRTEEISQAGLEVGAWIGSRAVRVKNGAGQRESIEGGLVYVGSEAQRSYQRLLLPLEVAQILAKHRWIFGKMPPGLDGERMEAWQQGSRILSFPLSWREKLAAAAGEEER